MREQIPVSSAVGEMILAEAKGRYSMEWRSRDRITADLRLFLTVVGVLLACFVPVFVAVCDFDRPLGPWQVLRLGLVVAAALTLGRASQAYLGVFLEKKTIEYPPAPSKLIEHARPMPPFRICDDDFRDGLAKSYADAAEQIGDLNERLWRRIQSGKQSLRVACYTVPAAAILHLILPGTP